MRAVKGEDISARVACSALEENKGFSDCVTRTSTVTAVSCTTVTLALLAAADKGVTNLESSRMRMTCASGRRLVKKASLY